MTEPAADADAEVADGEPKKEGQSFRSDRRLIRMVIFRYFADVAWRAFERQRRKDTEVSIKLAAPAGEGEPAAADPTADPATPPAAPAEAGEVDPAKSGGGGSSVDGLEAKMKKGFLLS